MSIVFGNMSSQYSMSIPNTFLQLPGTQVYTNSITPWDCCALRHGRETDQAEPSSCTLVHESSVSVDTNITLHNPIWTSDPPTWGYHYEFPPSAEKKHANFFIHRHCHPLFQLIKMCQPRQHNLFTCLFNLARQEHLVKDRIDLY